MIIKDLPRLSYDLLMKLVEVDERHYKAVWRCERCNRKAVTSLALDSVRCVECSPP